MFSKKYDVVNNENIWWGYKCGDNISAFSHRISNNDLYIERSSPITREFKDLKTEILNACKLISKQTNDINVLYSGGIDSEIIVRAFSELKIPFTVTIAKFKNDYNKHDITWALDLCRELDINPVIVEVDMIKWLENDLWDYANPLKTTSPQLAFYYWLIDQTPGYVIMGEGRVSPRRSGNYHDLSPVFMESYGEKWGISQWFKYRQKDGCPKFYRYTPELEAAYMFDQTTQDFVKNHMSTDFKLRNFKFFRTMVFQKYFPIKYKSKYTGFEKLNELDLYYRNKLIEMYPSSNSFVSYEWHLFEKLKLGEISYNNLEYINVSDYFKDQRLKDDFKYETGNSKHLIGILKND